MSIILDIDHIDMEFPTPSGPFKALDRRQPEDC